MVYLYGLSLWFISMVYLYGLSLWFKIEYQQNAGQT
jgi:hypothetical protein